jgi:hypothetical protein
MLRKTILIGGAILVALSAFAAETKTADITDEMKAQGYFVFVPLPDPNQQAFNDTEAFMDKVILTAVKTKNIVIIVRSCYNKPENLPAQLGKEEGTKPWWQNATEGLSTRYASFVQAGVVQIVDSLPGLPLTYTPEGWFYRNGEIKWYGQLNTSNAAYVFETIHRLTAADFGNIPPDYKN